MAATMRVSKGSRGRTADVSVVLAAEFADGMDEVDDGPGGQPVQARRTNAATRKMLIVVRIKDKPRRQPALDELRTSLRSAQEPEQGIGDSPPFIVFQINQTTNEKDGA